MAELEFDEAIAAQLDRVYRTRDIRRRRAHVLDALGAQPGDVVADVGCGPGYYVADLLDVVGPDGRVAAVDPAAAMREMTRRRIDDDPRVTVAEGSATEIPLADAEADRALSVQVFEYVPDVAAGLAELRRVLRPGGRVVIWDIDWSTLSWHARDRERMQRMTAAWDRHLVDPSLPRTLAGRLRASGFADVECAGHAFTTTTLDEEAFGGYLPAMIAGFVGGLGDRALADEAGAWLDELRELDAAGEYFFSVTQFCFTATRL